MDIDPSNARPAPDRSGFSELTAAAHEIIHGNYEAAERIFQVTRDAEAPDALKDLAELFGFMTVKVEAREFALEQALAEVTQKNADLEQAARLRAEFAKLFSGTVILLCLYALTLSFLQNELKVDMHPLALATHLVNLGLFVLLAGLMTWFLRKHHYPIDTFGLTWRNGRRALVESLLVCILVLCALAGLKSYLIRHDPAYAGLPVIDWSHWGPWQMFLIYAAVAFAQELGARGFMQSCIERLLVGKRRTALAVVLGAAEFGVTHLHYSFGLGIMAFLGAAMFGALYARHRTIVGITVAHYVLGQFIFGPLQLVR